MAAFQQFSSEKVNELASRYGNLIVVGIPKGTCFGLDFFNWDTRAIDTSVGGVKLIPPGLHLVYTKSRDGADTAPLPSGYFFWSETCKAAPKIEGPKIMGPVEVLRWDDKEERLREYVTSTLSRRSSAVDVQTVRETAQEEKQRLISACRAFELDRRMTPYPIETHDTWVSLTSHISRSALKSCGILSHEGFSAASEGRFYDYVDIKIDSSKTSAKQGDLEASSTHGYRLDRRRREKRGRIGGGSDGQLPPFFCNPYRTRPLDANIGENAVTRYARDRSEALDDLLAADFGEIYSVAAVNAELTCSESELLGEFQLSFVLFSIMSSERSLEHWKALVMLFCHCDEAIQRRRHLFASFVKAFKAQLSTMPEGFFFDPLTAGSMLTECTSHLLHALNEFGDAEVRHEGEALAELLRNYFKLDMADPQLHSVHTVDVDYDSDGEKASSNVVYPHLADNSKKSYNDDEDLPQLVGDDLGLSEEEIRSLLRKAAIN